MDQAIIVALGSNLSGDYDSSEALLKEAVAALAAAGFEVLRCSGWWRSAAWPDDSDPDYLNGACLVRTDLPPAEALKALHEVEKGFGRERYGKNAPRTLDLDLIAYGREISDEPALPHPRAHERRFVMGPVAEIAPDWRHPVLRQTAAELADRAHIGADARPV